MRKLEYLLDVRKHAEARAWTSRCARRKWDPSIIKEIVPYFPMRDERNQRVWAEVISAHMGVGVQDLLDAYAQYLRALDEEDAKRATAPVRSVLWWFQRASLPRREMQVSSTDPVELGWMCAAILDGGAYHAAYRVYGRRSVIDGDATRWRRLCRCGWRFCTLHGVPRRNTEQLWWESGLHPSLWPWVPVVPWSEWRSVPPPPWRNNSPNSLAVPIEGG
jgi:hypothetical protein